ncbi:hypothetical protein IWQ56_004744, partial [Coemansia nantahalensis]
QLTQATFAPPPAALIAQLVSSIKGGDLAAARAHYEALEAAADGLPSTRVFNALLMYAAAVPDCALLEVTWQRMAQRGIVPDAASHHTRLFCHSRRDDLLRTRRAYAEMLDYGQPPTLPAVSALVRCCVRAGDLDLALQVVRHAERDHGTALNATTYNYVLQCALHRRGHVADARRLFVAMLRTPDARLCSDDSAVAQRVAAEKLRFQDLRLLDGRAAAATAGPFPWSIEDQLSSARMRRALVDWLTAREAFSAEPTMGGAHGAEPAPGPGRCDPADAPPPTGTTFLIMMRASGQQRQWADVLAVWGAMLVFNRRIDRLAPRHLSAEAHRVAPFSRMVGWAARALVGLGRPGDARAAWAAGVAGGFVSPAAQQLGMDEMLRRLPLRRAPDECASEPAGPAPGNHPFGNYSLAEAQRPAAPAANPFTGYSFREAQRGVSEPPASPTAASWHDRPGDQPPPQQQQQQQPQQELQPAIPDDALPEPGEPTAGPAAINIEQYAIRALYEEFRDRSAVKIDAIVDLRLDREPSLAKHLEQGADPIFDRTLEKLGMLARRHPRVIIELLL